MKKYVMILMLALIAGTQMAKAQLPAVTLKSMEGKEVRTDTLNLMNQGRPIIIDFFATWCKPCNRELDAIAEVYQDWVEETGVKLIAVSIDQAHNQNKVKPLVNQHGWEYEVLLDPNSEFKLAMGIPGAIPYTMIIDGKGNIVYRHNGYIEGAEEELIEKVRELVKQ
ncbi:MAG: TlpA family protein disulfide reductase [Prevotella sp.]|jgi:peroxiredoxin|nr:TlpA family protein disulfide reductase [Prevotella sp.]